MDEEMTSTTFTLEGFRVLHSLGVVRGVTVRSRSLFGTLGARLETLLGGHISMLSSLCDAPGRMPSTFCWPRRSGGAPTASSGSGMTPPRSCRASPR